jgi:hypothetical protein
MAENIGEAQIAIEIALDKLRSQLLQAQVDVENTIAQTKKDIELNVKTNIDGQLQSQMDSISSTFESAKESVKEYSNQGAESFDEMGEAAVMLTAETSTLSSITALFGGSLAATAGVAAVVVIVIAELVVAFIAIKKFTEDVIEKVKLYVGQNEELTDAIQSVKDAALVLVDGIKEIYNALVDKAAKAIFEFIKGLVETWKEMNNTTGAGNNLLASLKDLMSSGLTAVMRIVDSVIGVFKAFTGQTEDSKSKVQDLTTVLNIAAGVLDAVSWVLDKVSRGIQVMGNWASGAVSKLQPVLTMIRDILSGIANLAASGLGTIFGFSSSGNTTSTNSGFVGPDQGNYKQQYDTEAGPGNQEGKNEYNQRSTKTSSKSGSSGTGKEKEVDLVKEEKKLLDEIIDLREDQLTIVDKLITLGQADMQQRNEIITAYLSELEAKRSSLLYAENIQTAEEKVLSLKIEQKKSYDDIIKQQQDSYNEIIKKAGKETESIKDYLKNNTEAEARLKQLKIQNEGDETRIALANLDEKYRKEVQNINSLKIAEELKQKLLKELQIKNTKEVHDINDRETKYGLVAIESGFGAVQSAIGSGFRNMWRSVFGEVNSLFEVLIENIYESLIQLAASAIFKTIIKALSGGGAGFLSFLFADGGYTGDGRDDEPAGIVHRNEFVVSAPGTSIPGNRELLEAMNRGEDVASLIGRAERRSENAEFIRASAFGQITSGLSGGEKSVNINLGGISVSAKLQKLTGLSENDWIETMDQEILPQISKALKRAGKEVMDSTLS